jgi:hypothetical protein
MLRFAWNRIGMTTNTDNIDAMADKLFNHLVASAAQGAAVSMVLPGTRTDIVLARLVRLEKLQRFQHVKQLFLRSDMNCHNAEAANGR